LAFCGASDPESQKQIDALLAEHGPSEFAHAFLTARGLDWAAELLTEFLPPPSNIGEYP
jgi:type IV secretion system protein TrbE